MRRLEIISSLFKHLHSLRWYMVLNVVICFLYELMPMASLFLVSYVIGAIIRGVTLNYQGFLFVLILLTFLQACFGYINMWTEHDIAYRILYKLRQDIYDRLEKALPIFGKGMSSAEIVSIVSNDMNLLEWFYAHTINIFIVTVVIALLILSFYFFLHPVLALNALLWIVGYLLSAVIFKKKSEEDGREVRKNYGILARLGVDLVQGLKDLLTFQAWHRYLQRFGIAVDNYDEAKKKDALRRSREYMYTLCIVALMTLCTLLISNHLTISNAFSLAWLPTLISLNACIVKLLNKFMSMSSQFSSIFAASERVLNLLNVPISVEDKGSLVFEGSIETVVFEDVSFTYPGTSIPQIKGLNFSLRKGEQVSLVGESGSGKTTIIRLIQRYADPQKGRILVNGRDIREYTLESWRNALSVVSQHTYLFKRSVEDNIEMGRPGVSKEEIRQAAKIAQAHEFIEDFPGGYATEVGERALKISGGQRQRLSIARAILKDSSFIIFDEAQSSLDSANEERLIIAMDDFLENRVFLSIAHRLSSIQNSHRILFMDEGCLVASGTFEELSELHPLFKEKILGEGQG